MTNSLLSMNSLVLALGAEYVVHILLLPKYDS